MCDFLCVCVCARATLCVYALFCFVALCVCAFRFLASVDPIDVARALQAGERLSLLRLCVVWGTLRACARFVQVCAWLPVLLCCVYVCMLTRVLFIRQCARQMCTQREGETRGQEARGRVQGSNWSVHSLHVCE